MSASVDQDNAILYAYFAYNNMSSCSCDTSDSPSHIDYTAVKSVLICTHTQQMTLSELQHSGTHTQHCDEKHVVSMSQSWAKNEHMASARSSTYIMEREEELHTPLFLCSLS